MKAVAIIPFIAGAILIAILLTPTSAMQPWDSQIINVQNGNNTNNNVITSPCTYLISQVQSGNPRVIQAQNCLTQHIDFQSTNASSVFNSVMNACNILGGCNIHIIGYSNTNRIHPYNITTTILLPQSGAVNMFGDGVGNTVLEIPPTYDNNMFNGTGTYPANAFFNEFHDFQMYGARNSGASTSHSDGFYLNPTTFGPEDFLIQNLFIWNFAQDDIFVNSISHWDFRMLDTVIEHAGRYGVYLFQGSDARLIDDKFLFNHGDTAVLFQAGQYNTITNCWFYQNDRRAIWLTSTENNDLINSNRFAGDSLSSANTYDELYFDSNNHATVIGNTFAGGTQPRYNIFMNSANDNNIAITGNSMTASASGNIGGTTGTTNIIAMSNVGYNPVNKKTNFIDSSTFSPLGTTSTVINGTTYTIDYTNTFVTSSGGTGVSITLQDGAGNNLQTGLTTLTQQYIPVGYKIKINFSTVPTVTVYFQ